MTIATTDPNLSTIKATRPVTSTRGVVSTSKTFGRVSVVAALIALPLVGATAATATSEAPNTATAHIEHRDWERGIVDGQHDAQAAQQQSYLDGLERAAGGEPAASPASRAAFEAQQRSYTEHLAHAASRPRSEAIGGQSASAAVPRTGDDNVPVPVAALLALGGLALGTGATVAARRLPLPRHQRLAV